MSNRPTSLATTRAVLLVVTVVAIAPITVGAVSGVTGSQSASVTALNGSPPSASFTYSPSTPNPDDTVTLDASGSTDNGTITAYEWDTDGDGDYGEYRDDADDGQTATVTYSSGGTYTVGVMITDDNGNTDTATRQITVENPAPTPSFTYSPSTPNPDDTVSLDASNSSDEDGTIVSYEWDTDGDGEYSEYRDDVDDGQTTSISYGSGGTYTVGLRVTDNGGETRTTTQQITVDNPAPTPSFTYSPSTPNPDDTVSLDASNSSDEDGTIVSYEWDTDGDGEYSEYRDDVSDGQTTSITYGSGGTNTVRLRVTDNGGKSRTVTQQITVDNPAPTPEFTYSPSTPNPDDTITLDASGASDPDGTITSYQWDTDGDGEYSEYRDDANDGQTTTVSYGSGGTYTVGLRITDNGGTTRTTTQQITVDNPAPSPSFTYSPSTPNPDDTITLDASDSTDEDGTITSFQWDTDGDGEYSEYRDDANDGQTTTVSYGSGGTYTVELRVTDNGGVTTTTTQQITVENTGPSALFNVTPSAPTPDEEVRLDASAATDPDGSIESFVWSVGDREVAYGQSATHEFHERGSYTIELTVTDNGGLSATNSTTVAVSQAPEPSLTIAPETIGQGSSVTFDASGSVDEDGTITEYVWQFDDGTTRYGETVSRSFAEVGETGVTLTVRDDAGHSVEESASFRVYDPPNASISIRPENPIEGTGVELAATSEDGIQEYQWIVDGETRYTGDTVAHTFDQPGEHTVVLRVTGSNGVTTQRSQAVSVDPDAAFELTSNQGSVDVGDTAIISFSVNNNVPDRELRARLQLALPDTGVSIASVEGGQITSRSTTNFIPVAGGGQDSLRVRMRFNEPGTYDIGGQSVYYYGNQSNTQQQSVEPVTISVGDTAQSTSGGSGPGFGVGSVLAALLVALAAGRYRIGR